MRHIYCAVLVLLFVFSFSAAGKTAIVGPGVDPDLKKYTLTVKMAGMGNVKSNPAGIDCTEGSGTCSAAFIAGSNVGLLATPPPNDENGSYGFSEWEGPDGALTCLGVGLDKEDPVKQVYSYRTKDWRYVLYLNDKEELYDHQNDPYEWDNLATDERFAEKKAELKAAMIKVIGLD